MTRKTRRLALIGAALAVLAIAAALVLTALRSSITFFASPTDVVEKSISPGQRLRLGGLVEQGSVKHEGPNTILFGVTDTSPNVDQFSATSVHSIFPEKTRNAAAQTFTAMYNNCLTALTFVNGWSENRSGNRRHSKPIIWT